MQHKAGDLVRARPVPMDAILGAVKLAWEGRFGDVPPLTKDFGYRQWEARVTGRIDNGHRLCRSCRKAVPHDARFCPYCAQQVPDKIFFGDDHADQVRFWIADERGCDVDDVPEDDIKARLGNADPSDFDY